MVRKLFSIFLTLSGGCLAATYANLPLSFEKYGEQQKFAARAAGFNLLISSQDALFALPGKPGALVRMRVAGANPKARIVGEELLPSRANYLVGNRASWRTNVEQYGRVRVGDILPSTDLVFYGSAKQPEFDLILHPGADAASIRLLFDGATPKIQANGDLLLETTAGSIVEHKPLIEQDGKQVEGSFRMEDDGAVGFEISSYDPAFELRIDPAITYSTYLGGTANDTPNAIALDSAGNAYIAGSTSSFNFPATPGALLTSYPGTFETVAFVAKLNATGSGLVYTTFLGGSGLYGGDSANAIAVDSSGNAYIAGTTGSANFPVSAGSLSITLNGPSDGFVTKLNPSGNAILYSTYLGGSGQESIAGIAIDSAGDAYVAGSTGSTNFPVITGAPQTILKSANDAFVAKLNPTGSRLLYSTYLGGSAEDDAYAIAVDSSGNAYVAGSTASTDFPVSTAAYKKTVGPAPVAFVAKLNAAGTALTYATYLGGTGGDSGNAVAVDSNGSAYVAGTTYSADFPLTIAVVGPTVPGLASYGHGFVTKLNPAGGALVYSTYLGGSGADGANAVAVDASGNATIAGFTHSANFPASPNSLDQVANFNPASFLIQINPSGTGVLYSTLFGATGATVAQAVALDATNHAFVAGYTESSTLPTTTGAFQTSNGVLSAGANTGFVTKLDLGSAVTCALSFSPSSGSLPVGGGSVTASVVVPAGCAWEAVTAASWFSINPPSSGVGPGSVTFNAGPNETSQSGRSATVTAGSASYTLTQAADTCASPQFFPATQTIVAAGALGSVAVALPVGCTYTAVAGVPWIAINSGASGSGDDLVIFTVAANATNGPRTGTIVIAGATYSITQTGAPCGISLTPSVSSLPGGGGSITASLVTSAGCAWTATSSAAWLSVSPASGTGSATLTLTAAANATGSALSSLISASGLSFTATQPLSGPPLLNVEAPGSGATVSGTINVAGWAIDNATAVSAIQIKVDGVLAGNATSTARADVCGAYGNKAGCPNVGFGYSLNTSAFTNGSHTITVSATDSNTIPQTATSSVTLTVANSTPLLNVESPSPGATSTGLLNISGWAIDSTSAIAAVQIKVDGTVAGNATATSRTDVCAAFGSRPGCPNVGFAYSLNTSSYGNGSHTITVSATDSNASPLTSTSNITVNFTNTPPLLTVESPAPGSSVSGVINVGGWAIDNLTAMASVQIKVDGAFVGNASSISRSDVCGYYGAKPGCPNVGFTYALNTSTLSPGSHTITVVATDSDSVPQSTTTNIGVTVANVPPTMNIEAPAQGAVVSGVFNVSGWAFDSAATIATVQIKLDGAAVGNATYGIARADVCSAFGTKPGCPNVGFNYSFNTSSMATGSHTISVVATDSESTPGTLTQTRNITVAVPPSVSIEAPASGATVSGIVNVSGWAINSTSTIGTAITGVQVKVDGAVVGSATYSIARGDVCGVFPGRPNCPNVGFTYALNTASLASGSHTISVIATDSDATPVSGTSTITVNK